MYPGFGNPAWQKSRVPETSMDRTERIHRIDQLLKDRKVVSIKVFLEEMEVSRSTVKRDLEYMRSRLDAPIDWDNKRRGYCYVEQPPGQLRFSLPGLWLSADEIQAFLLMEDLLVQLQPSLLRQHLAPLRTRLEALLAKGRFSISEVRRRIRILRMASRTVEPKYFQIVCSATLSRRRLEIIYHNYSNDEETQRVVSPQRLIYYKANWYLDAWCHLRRALRSFAVDAIRKSIILTDAAREVATASVDAHLGAGYGIYSGPARNKAILRFDSEAARWVAREQWHPQQLQKVEPNGSLILEIPYSQDNELIMDVLRYGQRVEVLKPTSLRKKVETSLCEALGKYRPIST
jgi:predicted DNA-binding transcriptional regulator YafY